MRRPAGLTRRQALTRASAAGATMVLGSSGALAATRKKPPAPRRPPAEIALPTPAQVRADFQRMVDFGPRLTGNDNHNAYIRWLERELVSAGVKLTPCSSYEMTRWSVGDYGLRILDGPSPGPVRVATYYPRSQETPAHGITGQLVYGGTAPAPSVNSTDIATLAAALVAYPAQLESWAQSLPSLVRDPDGPGNIVLVDLPMPAPLTTGVFLELATYLNWDGHSLADWATGDYKRSWVLPGLGVPLSPFSTAGAAAVVFILDGSFAALQGAYIPFVHGFEGIPALYVDRDTGTALRAQAGSRPSARLTLTATRKQVRTPSIVGVLPGESEENIILNTHTDGQGFAEENGGVCLVHLARHFGSLSKQHRLKRSVVFSLFTGHMDPELPETQGFINDNPQLIAKAAAALTIEHFGCSEWIDSAAAGYHATGQPETLGVWTTQGKMFEVVKDALIGADLAHTALLRPGVQFGVGGAFQTAGVPQLGAIAGPTYLVTVSENGDMDKLDEHLAARQIAWIADIMRRLDPVPRQELRQGDPTLGNTAPSAPGTGGTGFAYATCAAPAAVSSPHLLTAVHEHGPHPRSLALTLHTSSGTLRDLEIRLLHGRHQVAHAHVHEVSTKPRHVTLRPAHGHRFGPGRYHLRISQGTRLLAARTVTVHRAR
jgi:hypothetical protein